MSSSHSRRGRIHPHQRDTNDEVPILGAGVAVSEDHSAAVRNTELKTISVKNKRDYRNRIKHIIEFWQKYYPDYYAVGVRDLTEEELADEAMFWWRNKQDIKYEGLNVKMAKAFMAHRKMKPNGKVSSFVQIRKFHDSILYGAKSVRQSLPVSYYREMELYLSAFKKETAEAKQDGQLDEQEADPIPRSLFRLILEWALAENNIFLWVFTILQWNCMARSINIGVLSLHCFRVAMDSIAVKYDTNKADTAGEKVTEKHLYANPFDPLVSVFLAMGVWCAVEASRFEGTEYLFKQDKNQRNAASQRYCLQLSELFEKYKEALQQYIRADHANTHGIRKGSATDATAGTTCPPPIASIAARGEWSLGRVLDLYWQFAATGDYYLGRVLAGMDPNVASFAVLPPHWKMENPLLDAKVKEAMELMYGPILRKHQDTPVNPTGILLLCLASVVYHSDFLIETTSKYPGHQFGTIPLLSKPQLLAQLKEMVTIEKEGQIVAATGIPPHVANAKLVLETLQTCQDIFEKVGTMSDEMKKAVHEEFENRAFETGQMTSDRMQDMFQTHQQGMEEMIDSKLQELRTAISEVNGTQQPMGADSDNDDDANPFAEGQDDEVSMAGSESENVGAQQQRITYRSFSYNGRFWHVPEDFKLPSQSNLEVGWRLWLCGLPLNATNVNGNRLQAPIRPFRKFSPDMLPKDIKQKLRLHWFPIYKMMESAPDLRIRDGDSIDATYLDQSFQLGKEYLKTRVSYIFDNANMNQNQWSVGTWSKKVARSSIMKYGSDSDKANLPAGSSRNRERQQHGRRRASVGDRRRRTRRRVQPPVQDPEAESMEASVDEPMGPDQPPQNPETANPGAALPVIRLSAAAEARGQEIAQQVLQELEEERREADEEARRISRLGGPDGDGGSLFYMRGMADPR